ncbi:MAG: flagellar export protein FliJ [Treponema sp.]|nr:flagellar export protein FliJ [Treponema sp.]
MRRFHFKLEKILALRLNREHETELELGRAIGALTELENRIKALAEERAAAAASRFGKTRGAAEILSYDNYILRLDRTKDALVGAAAKAELAVEEARAVYIEASRDRKVLDKLKERRQKEYRRSMLAEEVKTLDDISGGRAARQALNLGA